MLWGFAAAAVLCLAAPWARAVEIRTPSLPTLAPVVELAGPVAWAAAPRGRLFAATPAGLHERVDGAWRLSLPGPAQRVAPAAGALYAATSQGLFVSKGAAWAKLFDGSVSDVAEFGGRVYAAAFDGVHSLAPGEGSTRREPAQRWYFPKSGFVSGSRALFVDGVGGVQRLKDGRWADSWTPKNEALADRRLMTLAGRVYAVFGETFYRADPRGWTKVFWGGGRVHGAARVGGRWHVGTDRGLWVRGDRRWSREIPVPIAKVVEDGDDAYALADASQQRGLYERTREGWKETLPYAVYDLGRVHGRLFAVTNAGLLERAGSSWRLVAAGDSRALPVSHGSDFFWPTQRGLVRFR